MSIRSHLYRFGTGLLVAGALAACASSGVQPSLERAQALSAAGHLEQAWQTLQRASQEYPESAELHNAALAARERYAAQLKRRAESALGAGRLDEARNSFRQLEAVPGQNLSAKEGFERVQQAENAPKQAASPSVPPVLTEAKSVQPIVIERANVQAAQLTETPKKELSGGAAPAMKKARPAAAASSARVEKPAEPIAQVAPMERKVTLEFRDASVRSLFDVIARTSGLNVIFDRDVSADLRTTVYLRNTTVRSAIEKIVLTSGLAWRNLDANTLLVYTDEAGKQNDYQALTVRGFQLANADAKFVASSLKTVLKFRDVVVDEKLNMLVVRDTPEAIAMAEKLIALHDVAEPEVMLEVAILEVTSGRLQSLGVAWPGSMSLSPLARINSSTSNTVNTTSGIASTSSAYNLTLRDLYNLTPGTLSMGLGATTLNFNATDSDINVLANPRIRAKNREKAKILIGERVPNISATATSNGVVSQNINYVDVGLKLNVEPQIFPGNEVELKITLEVSNINSVVENTSNGMVAYRIGTRNTSTVLRLKDGENQILAGLIQDSDRKSVSKVPLLGDIPLLGHLFRSDSTDKGKTEIVLSITPKLIRGNEMQAPENKTFDGGTLSSVRGRKDASSYASAPEQPVQQPVQQLQLIQPVTRLPGAPIDSEARGFGGSTD